MPAGFPAGIFSGEPYFWQIVKRFAHCGMGENHIPQRGVGKTRIHHHLDGVGNLVGFGAEKVGSENLIVVRIGDQFDQAVGFAQDIGLGNNSGRQGHHANVMPFGSGLRLAIADAGERRLLSARPGIGGTTDWDPVLITIVSPKIRFSRPSAKCRVITSSPSKDAWA